MADITQKQAAKKFAESRDGRGKEDGDCRKFRHDLMHDVLGIGEPTKPADFGKKVKLKAGALKRIDVYIP